MTFSGITPFRYDDWVALKDWEWAWLAGLFEGEGCIHFSNRASVYLLISMADRDVIEAVDRLYPSPSGLRMRTFEHKKTQWVWQVSERDVVRGFLEGIRPYLYSRRTERLEAALARLAICYGPASKRTHCKRGHPLSGENLYRAPNGTRHCLTCNRARDRARRR